MYLLLLTAALCAKTSTCSICIKSSLLSSSLFPLSSVRSGGGKIKFYGEEWFSSKWDEFRLNLLDFLCEEIPSTSSTVPTGTESQMSLWGTFLQHGPDPGRLERYLTIKPDKANIMPKKLFLLKSDTALFPGLGLSDLSCEYIQKCNDYHSIFPCGGLIHPQLNTYWWTGALISNEHD